MNALSELIAVKAEPSTGSVVEFDLNTVTVDLGRIPIDEVLDFRAQNLQAQRRYSLSIRKFAMELSCMPEAERIVAFELRQAELNDIANDLRKCARKAWRKPSSFALTLAGSALSFATSPLSAALRVASGAIGYDRSRGTDAGAYSYLFKASSRFGY